MRKPGPSEARLVGVFLFGCVLFGYPLLALFNVQARVFGVPLLFAYLFFAWALIVALVALLMERPD